MKERVGSKARYKKSIFIEPSQPMRLIHKPSDMRSDHPLAHFRRLERGELTSKNRSQAQPPHSGD
jgi:hypothetical protein